MTSQYWEVLSIVAMVTVSAAIAVALVGYVLLAWAPGLLGGR